MIPVRIACSWLETRVLDSEPYLRIYINYHVIKAFIQTSEKGPHWHNLDFQ